ncbi:MAG: hypothetical protein ACRD2N_25680 [Vicinamibacterales bacterium]
MKATANLGLPGLNRSAFAAVNLVFALFHPSIVKVVPLPEVVRWLVVPAVLLVLPSAGWNPLFGPAPRMPGLRLARAILVSTAVLLVSLLAIRLAGAALTDVSAWNAIWLIANLGFATSVWGARRIVSRRSLLRREVVLGSVSFVAAFVLFLWGAARVVPPQQDQDLEVMATGFGLLTRFEPLLLTDRHSVYFFAHPPLLHFYVGGVFLLGGAFDDLRYYDAASRRVRDVWEGRSISPPTGPIHLDGVVGPVREQRLAGTYEIVGTDKTDYLLTRANESQIRLAVEAVELDLIYSRYYKRPSLIEARITNIFFGACTVALLGIWAGRIARRSWLGALIAAVYATSPEVFVRSSYGGYFAVGAFASLLILLAAEHRQRFPGRGRRELPFLLGGFAALVDHKLVLLPVALAHVPLLHRGQSGHGLSLEWAHPAVGGFAAGTLMFWLWGLAIAPTAFIEDHLHHHLLDRITHHNPFEYAGYPAPLDLWWEFSSHTGYLLVPVGLGLLLLDWWRPAAQGPTTVMSKTGWLLWIGLTAVVFTIVDWRMTKHLVLLIVPLCLGLVPSRPAPCWRVAVAAATSLALVAFNIFTLASLAGNFSGFQITPAW